MADSVPKWALVTGATGGLGRAFCEALARRGYNLVLSARHAAPLEELAEVLRAGHGVEIAVEPADLAGAGAAQALKRAVEARGIAVETLINNAGFGLHGRFHAQPAEAVGGMVAVNVAALTELTHAFAADMAGRGGGHILLVASTAAFQPIPGYAVYAASKAYVLSLAHALHEELHRRKVVVSVLCPGPTATEFWARAGHVLKWGARADLMQPGPVAEEGLRTLYAGKPAVVTGLANRLMAFSTRLAPRSLQAKAAEVFMASGKKKG